VEKRSIPTGTGDENARFPAACYNALLGAGVIKKPPMAGKL
jgi:hypothetical protein